MSGEGEYKVELRPEGATLKGVMRLVSPGAYRVALAGVHDRLESTTGSYEIDVSGLQFLNSAGITALSRLVMTARQRDIPIAFVVDDDTPWQKKTLPSLAKLYPKLSVRSR